MKEIVTLSNGTEVECQAVSAFLGIDVANALGIIEPEKPTKTLGGVAKSKEPTPYAEDSTDPEWLQYKTAMVEYEERGEQFGASFHWGEGVIRWKLAGSKKFTTAPPKSWVVSPIIESLKIFSPELDPRRLAYIKYELLIKSADHLAVLKVITGGALLSSAEVDDAIKSFQD